MVEETEHKTVAFDTYMAYSGAYLPRAVGVFERQAFMRGPGGGDDFQPMKPAHAVIDMDDEVTGRKRLRFGQEIFGPTLALWGADQTVAQNILFGHDSEPRCLKTRIQWPDGKVQTVLYIGETVEGIGSGKPLIGEQSLQAFPCAI